MLIMAFNKNMTKYNVVADGWGDDPMTSDVDDSLWDDYALSEDIIEPDVETQSTGTNDDIQALEQEYDDAVRNGDDDSADCAIDALARIVKPTTKPNRRKKWVPPPQCSLPKKIGETSFKPTTTTWKKARPGFGPSMRAFPPIQNIQKSDTDDDLHRLATIQKGSSINTSQTTKKPVPIAWKVGATPYRTEKFNRAQKREKSGVHLTKYQIAARDKNHARTRGFERAQQNQMTCTRVCKSVLNRTTCPHGIRCRFAHTRDQLRAQPCHWREHCKKKDTCKFPHTDEEIAIATAKLRAQFPSV